MACDPGNIQCDSAGYRYVCQCYTSDGCQYYYDGTCSAYHSAPSQIMTQRVGYIDRMRTLTAKPTWLRSGANTVSKP